VYRGVQNSPVKGTAAISESGTIGVPGYHTIALSSPVPVEKGERFSVVVKLTTPGYTYPVAIEYPLSGFSSGARAANGESYISSSGTSWTDLNSIYPNSNVCLKAFTTQGTTYSTPTPTGTPAASPTPTPTPIPSTSDTRAPTVSITAPRSYSSISPGSLVLVTWSAKDNIGVAGVDIEYSKDAEKTWVIIAENLSSAGTYSLSVPVDATGTFIIRVRAKDSAGNEASATRICIIKSSSRVRSVAGVYATGASSVQLTPINASRMYQSADTRQPVVSIESPDSYTSVVPGSTIQVIWSAIDTTGASGVDIAVSNDSGRTWDTVAMDLANSGTYPLSVPVDAANTFFIRVTARDSSGNEGSAARICIVKSPTLSYVPVRTDRTTIPIPVATTIAIDRLSRLEIISSR